MGIQRDVGQQSAVVLLSGGLDSATCLAIATREFEVHALTCDYGGRHSREIKSAKALAKHYKVKSHTIIKLGLDAIGGSSLTDSSIRVPRPDSGKDIGKAIPNTYVPARNMIFLSLGIAVAEAKGAARVFIGANSVDFSGYPDCRPEFMTAFQKAADLGTKAGAEGKPVRIEAPLLNMSKAEIVRKGTELGVPYRMTWTCYMGGKEPCGKCEACILRQAGFREAGLDDPVVYSD